MRLQTVALLTAALITTSISLRAAAPGGEPTIGVATAVGSYSVNSSLVKGVTDLPDGSTLQTTGTPSEIHLQNGVNLQLATKSSGKIYRDHIVLEQGSARVGNFNGFTVNARQLQIASEASDTEAVIRMTKKTVEIASIGGAVAVTDGNAMLTRVAAGTKMSFQQSGGSPDQAQASQPAKTGAAPAPRGPSDSKTFLWVIAITAAAALAIGLTAAAQGKSPF